MLWLRVGLPIVCSILRLRTSASSLFRSSCSAWRSCCQYGTQCNFSHGLSYPEEFHILCSRIAHHLLEFIFQYHCRCGFCCSVPQGRLAHAQPCDALITELCFQLLDTITHIINRAFVSLALLLKFNACFVRLAGLLAPLQG